MPDSPASNTPFLGLGQWNDGDNPGAAALNLNWTKIDQGVQSASQDTLTYSLPLQKTGANVALNLGNNVRLVGNNLETIQNIRTVDSPQFAGLQFGNATTEWVYVSNNTGVVQIYANYVPISSSCVIIGASTLIGQDLTNTFYVKGNSRLAGNNKIGYLSSSLAAVTGTLNVSGSIISHYDVAARRIWVNKYEALPTGSGISEITASEEDQKPVDAESYGIAAPPPNIDFYVSGTSEFRGNINLSGSLITSGGLYIQNNAINTAGDLNISSADDLYLNTQYGSAWLRADGDIQFNPISKVMVTGSLKVLGSITASAGFSGITNATTASYALIKETAHGVFYSTASQAIVSTTATQSITYTNSDFTQFMNWTIAQPSRIYCGLDGHYTFQVSAVVDSISALGKKYTLWMAMDGANVLNSATVVQIPNATTETVLAVPYIVDFKSGSYVEFKAYGDDTDLRLVAISGSVYKIPWSPSIIVSAWKIN